MTDEIARRLEVLARLGEALARRRDDLVESQGEDIGAPCTVAGLEVDLAVDHLKTMAAEVPQVQGKRPYGTVAAIFPYDAPPIMLARVGGAAVLGGNRFRYSCSSQTPRSARILQEVVAPFPEIEAVTDLDNREFGQWCVRDPAVRVLFISGGGAVGEAYAREAQHFDKLFFAGPSGLPPIILFKDAPLEAAARFLVRRAFINGGQYCTTLKRAYIHQEIFEPVKRLLLEQAGRHPGGRAPGPADLDRSHPGGPHPATHRPGPGGPERAALPGAVSKGGGVAGAVPGGDCRAARRGAVRALADPDQDRERRRRRGDGAGEPLSLPGDLVRQRAPGRARRP